MYYSLMIISINLIGFIYLNLTSINNPLPFISSYQSHELILIG